ncbi:MAG: hypothetical protein PVJ49_09295 [Acidobacteriota bacterium]|jgi:hypothetical protein
MRLSFPFSPRSLSLIPVALLAGALLAGCSTPTSPQTQDPMQSSLRLSSAQILISGEVVNGQTMETGHMQGGSTLFQATLTMGNGGPALGDTVQVQYQTPGGGPGGMMHQQGLMTLYDDGTHGDPSAGDGVYCYADEQGQYGFHMPWAPAGEYHYEFFGFDHDDHHSNHMTVSVTMVAGSATTALQLSGAQVMVGGQVVNGQTMQPGQMHGDSTFFQATLTGPQGPAVGDTVQVHYQIPHGGMGGHMGSGDGYMYLYDDGTHGDPTAGDGIYCYNDAQGLYGFHMHDALHGDYHYDFFGFDHDDHHSNHMNVVVTIGG